MDFVSKIKELRGIMPIPMSEAMQLLKQNNGDVQKSAEIFKSQSIKHIQKETGCDEEMALKFYEREKYDLNRTISFIRDEIFDQNYKPIANVTLDNLNKTRTWIAIVMEKDFATSLDYIELDAVIKTLSALPALRNVATTVKKAKRIKDKIFEGYTDDLSIDEFVRRNVKLDDDPDFQEAYQRVTLSGTIIIDEINRHRRNLA